MIYHRKSKTIAIHRDTWEKLKTLGTVANTFDDVIRKLIVMPANYENKQKELNLDVTSTQIQTIKEGFTQNEYRDTGK